MFDTFGIKSCPQGGPREWLLLKWLQTGEGGWDKVVSLCAKGSGLPSHPTLEEECGYENTFAQAQGKNMFKKTGALG